MVKLQGRNSLQSWAGSRPYCNFTSLPEVPQGFARTPQRSKPPRCQRRSGTEVFGMLASLESGCRAYEPFSLLRNPDAN